MIAEAGRPNEADSSYMHRCVFMHRVVGKCKIMQIGTFTPYSNMYYNLTHSHAIIQKHQGSPFCFFFAFHQSLKLFLWSLNATVVWASLLKQQENWEMASLNNSSQNWRQREGAVECTAKLKTNETLISESWHGDVSSSQRYANTHTHTHMQKLLGQEKRRNEEAVGGDDIENKS